MSVNSDAECAPLQAPQAGPDSMSRAPACSLGAEQSPRQQQRSGSVTKATSLLSISLQEKGAQVLSSDSGNFHQASGLNPRLRQPQRAQSFCQGKAGLQDSEPLPASLSGLAAGCGRSGKLLRPHFWQTANGQNQGQVEETGERFRVVSSKHT